MFVWSYGEAHRFAEWGWARGWGSILCKGKPCMPYIILQLIYVDRCYEGCQTAGSTTELSLVGHIGD